MQDFTFRPLRLSLTICGKAYPVSLREADLLAVLDEPHKEAAVNSDTVSQAKLEHKHLRLQLLTQLLGADAVSEIFAGVPEEEIHLQDVADLYNYVIGAISNFFTARKS